MNDLSNTITEGITVQYADDTTFITDSWFTENCLIVNDSIIQMIPISTPQKIAHLPNINVTIKNTKIATCDFFPCRSKQYASYMELQLTATTKDIFGILHLKTVVKCTRFIIFWY